jgi:hypothetical protein
MATYNLLRQYQTGQFTNIQAVWIDNGTNSQPVVFTSVETGQVIRVPALSQGLFPIASAAAPIFTLSLLISNQNAAATTRLMLFNTPQRYFTQTVPPLYSGIGNFSAGFAGSGSGNPLQVFSSLFAGLYTPLIGFDLNLVMTAGAAWAANTPVSIILALNGGQLWEDTFNCTPASFGMVYSKSIRFPAPSTPVLVNDLFTLVISALAPGGTIVANMTYYYNVMQIS